jgi:tryptophanyl-tRNA synthetase
MSRTSTTSTSIKEHPRLLFTKQDIQNPHLVLTHDLIRNTKTLHYTIQIDKPPTSATEYSKSMRGYFGIMSSSDSSSVELNGNGEKVHIENKTKHTLWQPKTEGLEVKEPMWHLRVSVLKDQEGRGDCPSRTFVRSLLRP